MAILKTVTIAAALVVGATSFAIAQAQGSGGTDNQVTYPSAGAKDPPKPTQTHNATVHRKIYMSAGSTHKKGMPSNGGY